MTTPNEFDIDQTLVMRDESWAAVGQQEDITTRWVATLRLTDDLGCVAQAVSMSYALDMSTPDYLDLIDTKIAARKLAAERERRLDNLLQWARSKATERDTVNA